MRPRVSECWVVIRVVYARRRMLAGRSARRLFCWSSKALFRKNDEKFASAGWLVVGVEIVAEASVQRRDALSPPLATRGIRSSIPAPLAGASYPNSPSLTYYDRTIIACKSRSRICITPDTPIDGTIGARARHICGHRCGRRTRTNVNLAMRMLERSMKLSW